MPHIQAFRGIRYDLGHVGSLSDVIAPPYDVISPQMQKELYERHPANCVRLILNREEPGDDATVEESGGGRYSRAAKFFRQWQRQGVLFAEANPAVYVYHQQFKYEGTQYTRRGFMARVRLEPFGSGSIYPHEETMYGPKQDRLRLMTACRANMSQVFGLYPDPDGGAQSIVEEAIAGAGGDISPSERSTTCPPTPIEATDHLGVVHRLWPVANVGVISALTAAMAGKAVFIADGHHRYETACNYRDQLAAGGLDANHPANFVLMMCVGMSDPGMVVFPTHRLFRGLKQMDAGKLSASLGEFFTISPAGQGPAAAADVWRQMQDDGQQETLALFTAQDQRWSLARLTPEGAEKMEQLAPNRGDDWRGLGVSILHQLVVDSLLQAKDLPKPKHVHRVEEVTEGLHSPEFTLAALVMPPTLDHIRTVSERLERMPAKSTYFYPKLLSGLVFNPLE